MKKMAFAAMAVAAVALVSGPVAAQDAGTGSGSVATAPPATMQPIPNPPEKASAAHGAKHGTHHAKHHAKKHSMKKSKAKASTAASTEAPAATPAPQ